jgi:hypothetical protein
MRYSIYDKKKFPRVEKISTSICREHLILPLQKEQEVLLMDRIFFKIDDELKKKFLIICSEMGVNCSEMLRRMILLQVSKGSGYKLNEVLQSTQ